MVSLRRTQSSDHDFAAPVKDPDCELRERYPEFQNDHDFLNIIPSGAHVVMANEDGDPFGCGYSKSADNEAVIELKRMFVKKYFRGRGISKLICDELEKWAAEQGRHRIVLETGVRQPETIGLYESAGFNRIENYGEYRGNEMSVCRGKSLVGKEYVWP